MMLALDQQSLPAEELSIPTLTRELSLARRPNRLLCQMMDILERKRAAKGYGWSRPWNKVGLNVFRTHVNRRDDDAYYAPVLKLFEALGKRIPGEHRAFFEDLFGDPTRLGFTFYHNRKDDQDTQYEGLTISLGRKVPSDQRFRDRFDIILEDRRDQGAVDGAVDHLRVYSTPWSQWSHKQTFLLDVERGSGLDGHLLEASQEAYQQASHFYDEWKSVEARQWSHWSTQFISYFGPRSFIPMASRFR